MKKKKNPKILPKIMLLLLFLSSTKPKAKKAHIGGIRKNKVWKTEYRLGFFGQALTTNSKQ